SRKPVATETHWRSRGWPCMYPNRRDHARRPRTHCPPVRHIAVRRVLKNARVPQEAFTGSLHPRIESRGVLWGRPLFVAGIAISDERFALSCVLRALCRCRSRTAFVIHQLIAELLTHRSRVITHGSSPWPRSVPQPLAQRSVARRVPPTRRVRIRVVRLRFSRIC